MKQVKITYLYLGLAPTGKPRFDNDGMYNENGVPIFQEYERKWYLGSEMCPENKVAERVATLKKIKDEYGEKKYKDISIVK